MEQLGPEAQLLIRAGQLALRSNSADRERIARALDAHVGGLLEAHATGKSGALAWQILSLLAVVLGAGGIVFTSAYRDVGQPALSRAPTVSIAASANVELAPATTHPPTRSLEQTPPLEAGPRPRKPPADRLAEEVDILSRAEVELHAGRFASSLAVLDAHAREFARGTLAPERTAARIHALCGLGRTMEAEAELARLAPGSLHRARALDACAARNRTTGH